MKDRGKRLAAKKTGNVSELVNCLPEGKRQIAEALRQIIRSEVSNLEELVKWNAPSYALDGQDRLTFNFQGASGVRLVFHCGLTRKENRGAPPLFIDETGLLEWVSDIRAIARFAAREDVDARRAELAALIIRWLAETSALK